MKKIYLFIAAGFLAIAAIAQPPNVPAESGAKFGADFISKDPLSMEQLFSTLQNAPEGKKMEVSVKGIVTEVCTREGCWLKIKSPNGNTLVKMKDHAFLVPLAIQGKEIIIHGTAEQKTTSVKMLQHYAEDAGKSTEEIQKITEPKTEINIDADGIVVI
ncbi:MAG: DUF4920 domain-containing protein [Bacteroidetes bacterium]|nr:DUF4920 domain-containing protein [Bacteroidota bacterium]